MFEHDVAHKYLEYRLGASALQSGDTFCICRAYRGAFYLYDIMEEAVQDQTHTGKNRFLCRQHYARHTSTYQPPLPGTG
jgi:hypothetical protein